MSHEPETSHGAPDAAFDPAAAPEPTLRRVIAWLHTDGEPVLTLVLQAIIPVVTLGVTIWGSFVFWSGVVGNPWLALAIMVTLEGIGVVGLVLYVLDLAPTHPFRAARRLLPLLPAIPVVHTLHAVLDAAPLLRATAADVGVAPSALAWGAAGIIGALVVGVAWVAWDALAETLRNADARALARIERTRARRMRAIHVAMARQAADLEVLRAEALARRERLKEEIGTEIARLREEIPIDRANLAAKEQRLKALLGAQRLLDGHIPSDPDPPPTPTPALRASSARAWGSLPEAPRTALPPGGPGAPDPAGGNGVEDARLPGQAPPAAPGTSDALLRLAHAAWLVAQGRSQRQAAQEAGIGRTTLGERLARVGNDPHALVGETLAQLPADARQQFDRLTAPAAEEAP